MQLTISRAMSALVFTGALMVIRSALAVPAGTVGQRDRPFTHPVAVPSLTHATVSPAPPML